VKPAELDLNLLTVFEAIAEARSVTRAADRLGLSKAAMSRALGRLREAVGDPVLVRSGNEWALTERARGLVEQVTALARDARQVLSAPDIFRPATSEREFRVHATDHVVSLIGAALCKRVSDEAPHAGVRFLPILPDDVPALSDGVDLAIGVFPRLPADFRTQVLFEDRFACVARAHHPSVRGRLTLDHYLQLQHVLIAPRGRPGGVVDDALAERGLTRHVTRYLPYYLAALELIAKADCVLTMSERLARQHAARFGLQVVRPPLELPSYKIVQVWHPRLGRDRAHAWFRQVVAAAASGLSAPPPRHRRAAG
jgi:DNA-binding transcriptional LysR family regulator